jgi:crotonobetainyl-CoA:carnitine CoA-transferase CaiB-like acyl-CoA transferase
MVGKIRGEATIHDEESMSYDAPFAGLKVVDLSQGIAGPYCAMLLAQHGAEVIKVESLGDGDWARTLGVRYGGHTAFSVVGNLGKRSIAVDLKTAAGKDVVWHLLKGADVFLEGFRPGVIKRLGFDYEAVAAREPRLLYLSISGFGQTGPLADRPAMDPVLQAYTGLMNENRGEDGIPHRVPVIVVDMSTALYAFQALSATLYARRDETRGRYIDISLMQSAAALQSIRLMACHLEGGTMKPGGAPGGVFQIADGWMSMVAINDRDWRSLCAAMEMPALADEPRFADPASRLANSDALYAILRPAFAREPWHVWSERLTRARLMHERLNSYADYIVQPHVKETGAVHSLRQAGFDSAVAMPSLPGLAPLEDGTPRGTAPVAGEHTRAILAEHGYAEAEIEVLLTEGTVAAVRSA